MEDGQSSKNRNPKFKIRSLRAAKWSSEFMFIGGSRLKISWLQQPSGDDVDLGFHHLRAVVVTVRSALRVWPAEMVSAMNCKKPPSGWHGMTSKGTSNSPARMTFLSCASRRGVVKKVMFLPAAHGDGRKLVGRQQQPALCAHSRRSAFCRATLGAPDEPPSDGKLRRR